MGVCESQLKVIMAKAIIENTMYGDVSVVNIDEGAVFIIETLTYLKENKTLSDPQEKSDPHLSTGYKIDE